MRDKIALEELANNLKEWCISDLGLNYKVGMFEQIIQKMVDARISDFLKRRIGHLSDTDLINLKRTILETDNVEPIKKSEREAEAGTKCIAGPQLGEKAGVAKDSRKGKKG